MKSGFLLVMFFMTAVAAFTPDQERLITHVKKSIENATAETSKLTQEILALEGMSSVKVRHLLNNICSLPKAHYLEIGVWKGSTFVSALYNNTEIASAVAIDNWSDFGAPRTTLFGNVTKFLSLAPIDIYELDAFKLNKKEALPSPVDIYFYDGSTSFESAKKAFTYYNDSFADTFIAIVDDYNQAGVSFGVEEALRELSYDILFEAILPANYNGDRDNWWNGVYVAVIKKNGSGQRLNAVKSDPAASKVALQQQYDFRCQHWSDTHEHLPILKKLMVECSSVIEIGMRWMDSSWAFFQGLAESKADKRFYLGIDLAAPPLETFRLAQRLTQDNGIGFKFIMMNDMEITEDLVPQVDLLFIDSLHTYCHLMYELEKFSPKAKKYIALHDTSAPWGHADDTEYRGDYREYPAHFDRTKRGLWPAVEDFLKNHPEWKLEIRYFNNHGLTILKRVGN